MQRVLIIPAAGLGSRLRSDSPKALTAVNGRPMLDHLVDLFGPFVDAIIVIAHPSFADRLERRFSEISDDRLTLRVVVQPAATGMLDAILLASAEVASIAPERIWIVWCDQVALLRATLERLADAEARNGAPDLVFPTARQRNPYIHFPRDADGRISGVLQRREHDQMPAEGESDIGLFALSARAWTRLADFAAQVRVGSGTGERNFLPFIPWLAQRAPVVAIPCSDPREAIGINTPEELATVEAWLRERSATP